MYAKWKGQGPPIKQRKGVVQMYTESVRTANKQYIQGQGRERVEGSCGKG